MTNLVALLSFAFLFGALAAVIVISATPARKKQEPHKDFPRVNRGKKVAHTQAADQYVMIDGVLYARLGPAPKGKK